jgi:hypothetical protein
LVGVDGTEVAVDGTAVLVRVGVTIPTGTVRICPGPIVSVTLMPLAVAMASAVLLNLAAMLSSESPGSTM